MTLGAARANAEGAFDLATRLELARQEAPDTVRSWLDAHVEDGARVVGLARMGSDLWCAVELDETEQPMELLCYEPASGRTMTEQAFRAEQAQAEAITRGALSVQLHQAIEQAPPDARIRANVWARFELPRREQGAQFDVAPLVAELVALCEQHQEVALPIPGVPAVEVEATASLFWALAHHPQVGAIDLVEDEPLVPMAGYETMECIRLDDAEASYSADGTGIKVAVLDDGLPFPETLPLITQYAGTNCSVVNNQWHTGRVLSVLGANSGGLRAIDGSAPGASLYVAGVGKECYPCTVNHNCPKGNCSKGFCDYSDERRFYRALYWALDYPAGPQVDVVNTSYGHNNLPCNADGSGEYNYISRVLDYWATQSPWPVITKASGNEGNHRVSSGVTYNGIVVGAAHHQGTTNRSSHTIWDKGACHTCPGYTTEASCKAQKCQWDGTRDGTKCFAEGSQGRNRLGLSSLEVPHVAAPGAAVYVLDQTSTPATPSWVSRNGTSYAAPHVAGLAARILEARTTLKTYPEAVRAILLATATQDVNGVSLHLNDSVDDLDGAGEVDAYTALAATDAGSCWGSQAAPCGSHGVNHGALYSADFSMSGYFYNKDLYLTATGETAQLALTWTVNTTCTPSTQSCSGGPNSPMKLAMYLYELNEAGTKWTFKNLSIAPNANDNYLFIRHPAIPGRKYKLRFSYPGREDNQLTYFGLSWATY